MLFPPESRGLRVWAFYGSRLPHSGLCALQRLCEQAFSVLFIPAASVLRMCVSSTLVPWRDPRGASGSPSDILVVKATYGSFRVEVKTVSLSGFVIETKPILNSRPLPVYPVVVADAGFRCMHAKTFLGAVFACTYVSSSRVDCRGCEMLWCAAACSVES